MIRLGFSVWDTQTNSLVAGHKGSQKIYRGEATARNAHTPYKQPFPEHLKVIPVYATSLDTSGKAPESPPCGQCGKPRDNHFYRHPWRAALKEGS